MDTPNRRRLGNLALAIFLAGYFLYFNWGSLHVHFALDDLGNTAHYYLLGPRVLALSQFRIWMGDSRPMGGLFYVPIYHFAGLNPVPYQAVLLALLLANVYWVFRFARLLGCETLAAGLAALVVCYHAGLANLYYNAAFVFDVLCCFFYLAAFVYYMRIRNRGELLGPWRTAAFLALFLCALNSKEMAVTLPLMLLVYEWVYHPPAGWAWDKLWAWVRGPARMAWIAAVLTAVDVYGKVFPPGAMVDAESYHPVFTLRRMRDFQRLSIRDLFLHWAWTPGWGTILLAYVLLAYLAWRRANRPVLRFLFWYLVVAPLPIEFLVGKSQACLALLMVGLAIFAAVILVDLARGAAAILSREPLFARLNRRVLAGVLIAAAAYLWAGEQRELQTQFARNAMASLGFETWDLIQQLQQVKQPPPFSHVAFLDDPFHSFDMDFLAALWIHDRSVDVHTWRDGTITPEALSKMDQIFTFEDRKLVRVK